MDKHCIEPSCGAHACYGMGSALRGSVRFACRVHVEMIGFHFDFKRVKAPSTGAAATGAEAPLKRAGEVGVSPSPLKLSLPPTLTQGRLL